MSYEELVEAEQEAWDLFIKLDDMDSGSEISHMASEDWNRIYDHLQIFESLREDY